MDLINNSHTYIPTCKWCSFHKSALIFENAELCSTCHQKASWAAEHPKLCESCQILFTDDKITSTLCSRNGLNYSLGDARTRAEEGCGLCRIILLQDPNPDPRRLLQSTTLFAGASRVELPDWETGFSSHEDVDSLYFSTDPGMFSLTLSVSANADNPAAKFVSQRPVGSRLDTELINQEVKTWIQECFEKHSNCQNDSKHFMPTRVIDIGDSDDCAKLATPSTGEYVAMSYCWGRREFLRTLKANFQEHKKNIRFSSMPPTYQDAITTTRNLGFRYLWIDALCIIQDNDEDKGKEISMMGDIYTHAAITIASVSGTSVFDGFLQAQPQIKVQLPYRCPSGEMGQVEVSPQLTIDLWQESLYTRGWCLQENLLSKRILLYTGTEVVWQCQSVPMKRPNTTHVRYDRDDPSLGASAFRRLPNMLLNGTQKSELAMTEEEKYRIWTSIVGSYTRRKLTQASDRLPALDGIVQMFKVAWSDEYCYGIWKRQFIPSLGWYKNGQVAAQERFEKLAEYRAPSWSWASIDGPVTFEVEFDSRNSKISGAVVVQFMDAITKGGVPFLRVQLEASMILVKDFLKIDSKNSSLLTMDDHDERTEDNPWPKYGDQLSHLDDEMRENAWLMLLREGPSGAGKQRKVTALLLMNSDWDKGSYCRIGFLYSYVKNSWKAWAAKGSRKLVTII